MVKKLVLTICAVVCYSFAIAQTSIVSGNAKSYSGDTLYMYAYNDYISKTEHIVASAIVDNNGNFNFKIDAVKNTFMAYIDLIVFKGAILIQPNANIQIVLPIKQQLAIEDKLNPYFRPEMFYVKSILQSKTDLNLIIPEFDRLYNQALNNYFYSFKNVSKAYADSIEKSISANFTTTDNFFTNYRNYKFAMFDYTTYHRNKSDIVKKLFANSEVLTDNPAYAELFDEIFAKPFSINKTSVLSVNGLYTGIYDKSYNTLKRILLTDPLISNNDRLADYVILKGLNDSYYSDTFPKENIVAVIDSFAITSKNADFRLIAQQLSKKFTKLMIGFAAPDINLKDTKGNMFALRQQNKFTYINFFNPMSYTAQSDFELIKKIRSDFPPDVLQIVTIFVSQNYSELEQFMANNTDCNWPVLWYNSNTQLLKDYNIRAYPSYYIVGPDGKLLMNPAPAPTEYFEIKFSNLVRDWKIEQTRQKYRNDNKTLR